MINDQDSKKVLDVVGKELDRVDYGKITIVQNRTSEHIDIVTEERIRIKKSDRKEKPTDNKHKEG